MIYLGIDVGIINLACVKILVNEKALYFVSRAVAKVHFENLSGASY